MISILIPVYNTDVHSLVKALTEQIRGVHVPCEIILADDASDKEYQLKNSVLNDPGLVRYIELPENVGRAAIRNSLSREAAYPWLLFLDGDSGIVRPDFLQRYLDSTGSAQIVCGGRCYGPASANHREWRLHRTYGKKREQNPPFVRNRNPYKSFMTNNFLIHKAAFDKLGGFDERIRKYGHEDTLFGFYLEKQAVPLMHIDNPVEHLILDDNRSFVYKSVQAAQNLALIDDWLKDKSFRNTVGLLRFNEQLRNSRLDRFFYVLLKPFKPLIQFVLQRGLSSLFLLDMLKYYSFYAYKRGLVS